MAKSAGIVEFIVGRPKGKRTTAVQSVSFPRASFTRGKAVEWLERNGFTVTAPDVTATRLRYRQHPPSHFEAGSFRTIPAGANNRRTNPVKASRGDDHGTAKDARALSSAELKRLHRTKGPEYPTSELGGVKFFSRQQINREFERRKQAAASLPLSEALKVWEGERRRNPAIDMAWLTRHLHNVDPVYGPDMTDPGNVELVTSEVLRRLWKLGKVGVGGVKTVSRQQLQMTVDRLSAPHIATGVVHGHELRGAGLVLERDHVLPGRFVIMKSAGARRNPRSKTRRNPDAGADAAALYESFTGKPSHAVDEFRMPAMMPKDQALLGPLVELRLKGGSTITVPEFDIGTVLLTSNAAGTQLYCVGEVTLKIPTQDKEWVDVAPVTHVVYRCQKKFDNFRTYDYDHKLGEEGGDQPLLLYNTRTKTLAFAGGSYKVRPEGIRN